MLFFFLRSSERSEIIGIAAFNKKRNFFLFKIFRKFIMLNMFHLFAILMQPCCWKWCKAKRDPNQTRPFPIIYNHGYLRACYKKDERRVCRDLRTHVKKQSNINNSSHNEKNGGRMGEKRKKEAWLESQAP